MVIDQFYLSDIGNADKLQELSGLAFDEIQLIVGTFKDDHWRFGNMLKGEVLLYASGKLTIRHHFTKKLLWTGSIDE